MLLKAQIIITAAIILIIIGIAVAAPYVAPYKYDETDFRNALSKPGGKHVLGTDQEGRDMLSRIIYGARVSIAVALGTAGIALVIGTFYGAVSGYIGGKVDELMMRVVDVFYSLPDLLLIVLITLVIGRGVLGIVLALGASPARILGVHIIPNILSPLIITLTFSVPYAILAESTLSFLGLGIAPPESSWGTLASTGWQGIRTFPHLIVFPSLAIFITAFSFNLFGEGIRDYLDPQRVRR